DPDFFNGSLADLSAAREVLTIPLLRKEFIVDTYQIAEAKAYGADIILLIAACLDSTEIETYADYAKSLGLNVLVEVHNEEELDPDFFNGSLADLSAAREVLTIPLLRKEFIVDTYQIAEAKAYGADIILLIAACLDSTEIETYADYAKSLGLNVLVEVHNEEE